MLILSNSNNCKPCKDANHKASVTEGVVKDFRSSLQKGPNVDRCSLALEIEKGSWELFALGLIRGKVAIH